MNTLLLNQLLLAAATEPWEQWWDSTRLIFADFVEECGEPDKAGTLRTMACEVADEIDTENKSISQLRVRVNDEPPSPRIQMLAKSNDRWHKLRDFVYGGNETGFSFSLPWSRVKVVMANVAMSHELIYSLTSDDGQWQGTLSLDRAQRRCRRRVLEMFPDQILEEPECLYIEGHEQTPIIWPLDDSPRWVPFERRPQINDVASTMLSLIREHGPVVTEMLESVISTEILESVISPGNS